jgi:hypothetical protein
MKLLNWMKWFIYILFIITVVVLNQTLFRVIEFGFFVPDLLLLFTLAVVWSFNNFDFLVFGLLGGTWLEILAGLPIGSLSIGIMLVGSLAHVILNRWLFSEKPWQYFLGAVALGTLLIRLWMWFYTALLAYWEFTSTSASFAVVWQGLLPALVVNLLLIYPIFALVEMLAKYAQNFSKNKLQL